ncbi:hypothetical protein GCM10011587_28170 [Pyruvatibacter mobilis]|nr:hypothetical protein GCM10011587_28170 [Pyruvatibacter mobilis]
MGGQKISPQAVVDGACAHRVMILECLCQIHRPGFSRCPQQEATQKNTAGCRHDVTPVQPDRAEETARTGGRYAHLTLHKGSLGHRMGGADDMGTGVTVGVALSDLLPGQLKARLPAL